MYDRKRKTPHFKPKLGQHFLNDPNYKNQIIEELRVKSDELVIEIGLGRGAMTGLLAGGARKVVAIEVDPQLASHLEMDFAGRPEVRIVLADVLRVDLASICEAEQVPKALVFGNLPYYITSPILHRLFAQRRSIKSMGLLMQREVAERLVAEPGSRDYGYLTVATQAFTRPWIAFGVPPGAFAPAPKVQSALVTFAMRERFEGWDEVRIDEFLEFVKRCFAQKRKNLLNNLAGYYQRVDLQTAVASIGKSATARAEELSVEEFSSLFRKLEHDE